MVDIRQSKDYALYLSSIGWIIERTNNTNYFIKKIPLIGSVIKIQRPKEIDFKKIEELSKKYRAFQIILEPKDNKQKEEIKKSGFRLSNSPYLPTKTLELNLTKSEKDLLKGLKKDCRRIIEKTKVKIVKVSPEKFQKAWKKAVGLKRYVPPISQLESLKKTFGKNSLFITTHDYSAGAIFLRAGGKSYYWQAFANKVGRKNNYQYKIVWEGIIWAKKLSAKVFDFEGIYDARFPNKSWLGFTHFKKSFGGKETEYPETFTKFLLPFGL
jgi:lipid II:glycine glycyltransferase (peptidoglycan interpeptide bridge formation enzyme)